MKSNILKIFLFTFIAFWYFFAGSLLTKLLYPLECRGIIPYIVFRGETYNFIDMNIPHLIAFIVMGIIFKSWALWFAVIGELLQAIIKNNPFSFIDMLLNLIGAFIGIFITKLKLK